VPEGGEADNLGSIPMCYARSPAAKAPMAYSASAAAEACS
jgi:hypothetical protein